MFLFDSAFAQQRHQGLSKSQLSEWVRSANASLNRFRSEGMPESNAQAKSATTADASLTSLTESICESLAGNEATVDAQNNVIRGVKLIGSHSRNGRDYPPHVLKEALPHYEGVRVNIDHPDRSAAQPRSVRDRIGVIRSTRFVEGKGIFGDFHFNPKHQLASQIAWEAEHNPSALGFSHNASLRMGTPKQGRLQVESINSVRSVDLVADPATTNGFYEHDEGSDSDNHQTPTAENEGMELKDLTLQQLRDARPDLITALEAEQSESEELEQLKAEKKAREKKDAIEAELKEAGLDSSDEKQVTKVFIRSLEACESVEDRKELIRDRKALVGESSYGDGDEEETEGRRTETEKPRTSRVTEGVGGRAADSGSMLKRLMAGQRRR